tara:strand:- start:11 stop:712 length:702 start_codon:yes stop_codon:yes gene_type:complete
MMHNVKYDPELSRDNPSPKYKELLKEYVEMHQAGEGMFDGKSLTKFIYIIDGFLKTNECKTLLDYGAGKGTLYTENFKKLTDDIDEPLQEYWGLNIVDQYEPALFKHNTLPDKHYDAVICTDVLEHVPTSDLGWVVDEILERADKMAFFNIACYPALKKFLDGTNVHVSIFSPDDWLLFFLEKIDKCKNLSIYLFFDVLNEKNKKVTLEGFKIDNKPRLIKLKEQEVTDDRDS